MARDIPEPLAGPSPSEHPEAVGDRPADPGEAGKPAPGGEGEERAPAVAALLVPAAAKGREPSPKTGKPRKLLYVTLPGCWGALIFACLSFTPSLLPRGGLLQGVVCGITAAIGYGLGVLA